MSLKLGIEIEAVTNKTLLDRNNISIGSYHRGAPMSDHFETQSDSSINGSSSLLSCGIQGGVEFVSTPCSSRREFIGLASELKRVAFGGTRLADCMVFDTSCGMHTHFSIDGGIGSKAMYSMYATMREKFFAKLEASTIIPAATKTKIKNHYFRSYARAFTEDSWKNKQHERQWEFNFISEESGRGLEWRSVNATGIRTWEEFEELLGIVWDCCKWFTSNIKTPTFKKTVIVDKKKIEEMVI